MKKILVFLLFLSILLSGIPVHAEAIESTEEEMRGLWVATVVNIDYPTKATTNSEALKAEALKILDLAKDTGFNAVFLQVRPTADALYKSQYFPWSKYLTGKQGLAPDNGFDPLKFWVEEAHKRNLELHAWLNPYRVTKRSSGEPKHDFASLDPSNPARLHPEWVVKHSDGNLYFDPGIPEVRHLILCGIYEIIYNYDVDGIHFDDYFYPDKGFDDKASSHKYKPWNMSLDDWRRENVNTLIRNISSFIKATGKKVSFGISPFGIWANKSHNPLGSDTAGLESYYSHYADSLGWVKEGIIDYITPQIYWNIGYNVADYSKLLSWWSDAVSGTNVDLYIGHAVYKAGNSDPKSPWYGTDEIIRQLTLNTQTPEVKGSIFYNYSSLKNQPALSAAIKAFYEAGDNKISAPLVYISRPSGNIETSYSQFYLNGFSDPSKPLYLNGKLIQNRSTKGYFGILVPLSKGANVFTVSQEGSSVTRVIYRTSGSSSTEKLSNAEIPSSSTFPQAQEYRMSGEKITLSCKAPVDSNVTVKLGGKTYTMKPSTTSSSGSGITAATYTYVYTIPSYTGTPRVIDLGYPVYTMNYKGTVKTRQAPAKVGVIMKGAPFYAEAIEEVVDTYEAPVTGNGAYHELYKGMTASVTGMTGNYLRLSTGDWVFKNKVKTYTLSTPLKTKIETAEYKTGEKWDTLSLKIGTNVAAISSFDGTTLKMTIATEGTAPSPKLPSNSLFSSVSVTNTEKGLEYSLKTKPGQRIEGYWIEKTPSGLELKIKRKATITNNTKPLSGITIVLDPGHGGTESGAIGPLGMKMAEKDINLNFALILKSELEKQGATIILTRATDTTVSLANRLSISRMIKPDLFISLHANSMADNVDISKIEGFSIFYREELAKPLSDSVYNHVINTLHRNKHGVNKRNFYVTRGTWAPSILIESGFVPNPSEFQWLTDKVEQTYFARTITNAIINYYKN